MKKKGWITVGVILAVLVAAAAILVISQWNNIRALRYMQKYTPAQRQELLTENEEEIRRILEKFPEVHVEPLNEEQEKQLREGTLTEEDALLIIRGFDRSDQSTPTIAEESEPVSETQTDPSQNAEPNNEANLQEQLAKIYLLRSSFSGKLDGLIEQAKAEYTSQNGNVDKAAFAKRYLQRGTALEAECDARMEELLGRLSDILKSTGGDLSTIDEIRSAYKNEKSVKKAALLDQYQ